MLLIRKLIFRVLAFCALPLLLSMYTAENPYAAYSPDDFNTTDTIPVSYSDSLRFPINDRRGDFISGGTKSTFDFGTPTNI